MEAISVTQQMQQNSEMQEQLLHMVCQTAWSVLPLVLFIMYSQGKGSKKRSKEEDSLADQDEGFCSEERPIKHGRYSNANSTELYSHKRQEIDRTMETSGMGRSKQYLTQAELTFHQQNVNVQLVLRGALQYDCYSNIELAKNMYTELTTNRVPIYPHTYQLFIQLAVHCREATLAKVFLASMKKSGHNPSKELRHAVLVLQEEVEAKAFEEAAAKAAEGTAAKAKAEEHVGLSPEQAVQSPKGEKTVDHILQTAATPAAKDNTPPWHQKAAQAERTLWKSTRYA
eukprot:gnl/MRDRNA2_/MRDRNA2_136052_c0_seq1.p1 gnl/MRDRNA2_/MRDRNA2_136052_c0~~gnl/MRDRNA2_/MRDRNA2_136052_c0_seq1.p1  ORF type:complete len:285 (-),score=61.89 gnl/MRDRNA2_/MRDRNA2_136052_c0_seq1:76-930(-)